MALQEIGARYTVDVDDFLRDMQKVSDRYGEIDQQLQTLRKTDPFAQAATSSSQANKALGLQIQTYQRVEAVAASFRKEQERISSATAEVKKKQDELVAANRYGQLKGQIGQVETALERMNAPLKETDSLWDKIKAKIKGIAMPKFNLPNLSGNKTNTQQPANSTSTAILDEVAGQAGLPLSGGKLAAGAAVAATATAVIKGTKEWAAYGEKLSEVSALTGATGKSLQFLDDQAQRIEKDTGIAGTQILEAFKSIAGIKPELLESNEALAATTKEVITLSQASKLSLEDSAKALLGSLSQFDEGADQAARFSNVLAAGAKLGNSEINDTAEALKNSGTAMKAAGLSFEQGNALLQILASKMIKGGEAGTALRNVLLKLETDTDKNLRPSIVGLDQALENAAKKYDTTSERAKIFGTENIVAASQVLDASKDVAKMTETLTGTSVAYEQAKTNSDNLATDLRKAGTSIDSFFRNLGQSQDGFLRGVVQRFTSAVNEIGSKTGVLKTFISSYLNNENDGLIGALFTAGRDANKQRQANLDAARKEALQSGIATASKQSVNDDLKILTDLNKKKGDVQAKAERDAAATVQKQRDTDYQAAVADHQRLKKELEREMAETGKDSGRLAAAFEQSRENLLAKSTAKKVADDQVNRLKKQADDQAKNLAKLLGEGPSDAQKKADKKALDDKDESNRLLLEAQKSYQDEAQKLELQFGKERLERLNKDGAEYINAQADLAQAELKIQRDAIEKKLQLAKSDKTAVVNGKRVVVADTSKTLENSAPQLASAFANQQQQIEQQRQRDLEVGRVRQEYKLIELSKQSYQTELQLFDKQWEERLLIEQKNAQQYLDYEKQYREARNQVEGVYNAQDLAAFDKAWKAILANEAQNAEVYNAMIKKRDRDRNTLVVDQLLRQTKSQEEIETAFTDTKRFGKNLQVENPNLNAQDILEASERAKIAIRIKYGEQTIALLREQGESQNALLITQTQAQVDALKDQQADLERTKTNPRFRDFFSLIGITDGMNSQQLKQFDEAIGRIKTAIQETTQTLIQESEARIQTLDTEISAKEQEVQTETDRNKQGYANNLALRQQELQDLREQKAREEEIRRNALKVQQTIDLASAVSSGIVTSQKAIEAAVTAFASAQELGPIVGIFAGLAAVATVIATVVNIKSRIKALTSLRTGGRLVGPKHEQGGIRGTGYFSDIEVEGGEHVTSAANSERYDKTLQALNKNNPHYALQMLLKEANIGLPEVIIQHINSADFKAPVQQSGFSDKQLKELTDIMREQLGVARDVAKNTKPGTIVTPVAPGILHKQTGNNESYVDVRDELKKKGIKLDQ